MDAEETQGPEPRRRMKLAAALGVAALALPGGALIGNAFAAGDGAGTTAPAVQEAPADPGFAPVQESDPLCPEDEGGAGSGDSEGSSSGTSAETAL